MKESLKLAIKFTTRLFGCFAMLANSAHNIELKASECLWHKRRTNHPHQLMKDLEIKVLFGNNLRRDLFLFSVIRKLNLIKRFL